MASRGIVADATGGKEFSNAEDVDPVSFDLLGFPD